MIIEMLLFMLFLQKFFITFIISRHGVMPVKHYLSL